MRTFDGAVGTTALSSLTTDKAGTTDINGGSVTTTGDQTYNDAVTLIADTTLTGVNVTFGQTLDAAAAGKQSLTVNASGTTTFDGAVGTTALSSLTTDKAGTTDVNGGSVTTTGDQTYNDAVVLSADTTLTGVNVTFGQTLDAVASGKQSLTVNASGTTTFDGAVGTTALSSLTTDKAGTTDINGGSVTTTGDQTYNDAVVLGADTTLTGVNVTFGQTLDAAAAGKQSLTVNASGTTTFD